MKVKMFVNDNGYPLTLEAQINQWLEDEEVDVYDIVQSQDGQKTVISVFYQTVVAFGLKI